MMFSAPKSRPVLIYGAGIHLSNAEKEALEFAQMAGIPVAPTWAGLDLIPSDDPLCIGSFGTHGTRAGNFAVQNANFILSVGSRLDSKATGTPIESFAREANICMVDVDQREISKFGGRVQGILCDAKEFFMTSEFNDLPDLTEWKKKIAEWKSRYPSQGFQYDLIRKISEETPEDTVICTDTGCAVAWVSQAWKWKKGQRFIHAFNQTPMGYGLPASIGACYASSRVVLISGDGSLMMSIGELATIAGHKLPIKIFMFNNQGHGMCRQTQREWLGSAYPSTSIEGGLTFPRFRQWARGCDNPIQTRVIDKEDNPGLQIPILETIQTQLNTEGPTFTELIIDPECDVVPKVKYGYPNEDGHPLLPRDEFNDQMIVEPWNSLTEN